jgi:hypothetical protein
MKKFGYDKVSGALFSCEFDLHFEGISQAPPDGAFISINHLEDEMIGCAFMSGWTDTFVVIHSDGFQEHSCLFGFDSRVGYWKGQDIGQDDLNKMSARMPICVCGEIVCYPDTLAGLCSRYPVSRMYVCPLVDELAALGVLVRNTEKTRPRRMQIVWENKDTIDAEFKEFDPKLDGDGLGRMADLVANGFLPVNEMMTAVGVSPFYGKTLHRDWIQGSKVIVRRVEIDSLFPQVPISAKNYAAISVFVRMETTEQFRSISGYNGQYIDVFVSTDTVPGVSTFMRFYKTFSGKGFVFVSNCDDVIPHEKIIPVFRSDRAYRVAQSKYEQSRRPQ